MMGAFVDRYVTMLEEEAAVASFSFDVASDGRVMSVYYAEAISTYRDHCD